jgi:hypothetical protein
MKWTDASSYSRGERGEIDPTAWETRAAWARLGVTRRHGSEGWYGYCHELNFSVHSLGDDLEKAKTEWIRYLKETLTMVLKALK